MKRKTRKKKGELMSVFMITDGWTKMIMVNEKKDIVKTWMLVCRRIRIAKQDHLKLDLYFEIGSEMIRSEPITHLQLGNANLRCLPDGGDAGTDTLDHWSQCSRNGKVPVRDACPLKIRQNLSSQRQRLNTKINRAKALPADLRSKQC